jgi:DNA-binding transcriptional LysR family regulator
VSTAPSWFRRFGLTTRTARLNAPAKCVIVVKADLLEGRLVDVLPGWAPQPGIIHAVFPSRRGLLPAVRTLLDFLGTEYAALSRKDMS